MIQKVLTLTPKPRGFHIITDEVMAQVGALPEIGMMHLFIQHTSAAITINEAADPDVLTDFESIFNQMVPENMPFLTHTLEGPDDMPAHIKAAMIGHSVSIPITQHQLNLGRWQGLYLCEFRNRGGSRRMIVTIWS